MGGNNASGAYDISVSEANKAFRAVVPHYPVPKESGVWQSFKVGHISFSVTDSRTYLYTNNTDNDAPKDKSWTYFGRE
jgi:hypothetical protein